MITPLRRARPALRLYCKLYHAGVMPGPSTWIRDRLIRCEPRPITRDLVDGPISSSVNARINERAGLTRDRRPLFGAKVHRRELPSGRTIFVGA